MLDSAAGLLKPVNNEDEHKLTNFKNEMLAEALNQNKYSKNAHLNFTPSLTGFLMMSLTTLYDKYINRPNLTEQPPPPPPSIWFLHPQLGSEQKQKNLR